MWEEMRPGIKTTERVSRLMGRAAIMALVCIGLMAQPSAAESKNYSVTGFFRVQGAGFLHPDNIETAQSHNNLAVQREWFQLDVNYQPNDNHEFFFRGWAVFEGRLIGNNAGYAFEEGTGINDSFYNELGIREAWWKYKLGSLTLFTGKQIVTWGESVAFRVNDQINPQDLSFAFGFANLEESRIPQWMVHPIYYLPSMGMFNSNFIEAVWLPGWDFGYNHVNYPDKRYMGQHSRALRVDTLAPGGGRFAAARNEGRVSNPLTDLGAPGVRLGTVDIAPLLGLESGVLVPAPFSRALAAGGPQIKWRIPGANIKNSQFGFRLGTIVGQSQFSLIYWRSHERQPVGKVNGPLVTLLYPHYQGVGASMNRPLNIPGIPLPFVMRAEVFYKFGESFNTLDPSVGDAVTRSDTVNYIVALDVSQAYTPWLTDTGNLNLNIEYNGKWIVDYSDDLHIPGYNQRWHETDHNFLISAGTSWWWGAVAPTLSGIYNPDGNSVAYFPALQLVPPWTNKYFFKVQYIGVLGSDKYASGFGGVGLFKGKELFFGQFQYNIDFLS